MPREADACCGGRSAEGERTREPEHCANEAEGDDTVGGCENYAARGAAEATPA
jgi:hypothetical protein